MHSYINRSECLVHLTRSTFLYKYSKCNLINNKVQKKRTPALPPALHCYFSHNIQFLGGEKSNLLRAVSSTREIISIEIGMNLNESAGRCNCAQNL